jgi:hypothetical protein
VAETVAAEYLRFVAAERRAHRLPPLPPAVREGEATAAVSVDARRVPELMRVAARRAAGFFRPTKRTEVVWVRGENQLAVGFGGVDVKLSAGLVRVLIPVRADQTGNATVVVMFAVGSPDAPAGLYAATPQRPTGPELVVEVWGDALVAFAWQCVLGFVTGVASATGKDTRGNVLVPVEFSVTPRGALITPMARHRFAGSSTLKTPTKPPVRP